MKRIYKDAVAGRDGETHVVLFDGRPLRTPKRAILALPSAALAEAVATEWADQGAEVDPATMPMMRLATTAVDRIAAERPAVLADLAAYGASDLLCYRTESPAELAARQAALWQPLLDWAAVRHGAMLTVTSGLVAVDQPEEALRGLKSALEALTDHDLMAVHTVTVSTGSLVIALALHDGHLDARRAFEAGCLDDLYALEVWGEDKDGRKRLNGLKADIEAAERLLSLLRTEP